MSMNFSLRRYFWGLLFVGIGVLLLLDSLGQLDFEDFIGTYWPVLLILIGIKMLLAGGPRSSFRAGDIDTVETTAKVNVKHTFGDVRLKLDSKEFIGGNISNVFGNIEVDMENIRLKEGIHHLELKGVFGDLVVILPKNAPVSVTASTSFGTGRIKDRSSSGIAGDLVYTTEGYHQAESKLAIEAHQTFGDIRVF